MTPEKLNLWDLIFNRTRKEVLGRGQETWHKTYGDGWQHLEGSEVPNSKYKRNWFDYKIIDRLTGSETIKREYLD